MTANGIGGSPAMDDVPTFGPDPWEKTVQDVVRDYLIHQPEQGGWPWEDHCDGVASGILSALYQSGYRVTRDI
jgi:hypothetical protein